MKHHHRDLPGNTIKKLRTLPNWLKRQLRRDGKIHGEVRE
jgi:hypothetical protein